MSHGNEDETSGQEEPMRDSSADAIQPVTPPSDDAPPPAIIGTSPTDKMQSQIPTPRDSGDAPPGEINVRGLPRAARMSPSQEDDRHALDHIVSLTVSSQEEAVDDSNNNTNDHEEGMDSGNGDGHGDEQGPGNDEGDGEDSAYSSNDEDTAYTQSATASVFNYKYENGRRYHAYREGQYVLPNDDQEQERLNFHHHLWRRLLDDRLFTAPLPPPDTKPELFILDLGTGTGVWAMDMADEYLSSTVYGIDLSPIQPEWVPNNCRFFVDDYEDRWTYREDEKFDFIHGRGLSGSSSDWPRFYAQAMEHLKPGGWIEMQEYENWVYSDDDSLDRAPWTQAWCKTLEEASSKHGRTNVAKFHKQWIMDAGFEGVEEKVFRIPIGPWAKESKLKELGILEQINRLMAVDAQSLALLTRILHYSEDQARILIEGVKREFRREDLHFLISYRFIYGRRPLLSVPANANANASEAET